MASPGTIATAFFVIAHCRTFVLPASRFLACVHFRSSPQRVDFIDTLKAPETGAFLWEKLYAGTTKEEMLRALLEEYEVSEEEAEKDIETFLEALFQRNIL